MSTGGRRPVFGSPAPSASTIRSGPCSRHLIVAFAGRVVFDGSGSGISLESHSPNGALPYVQRAGQTICEAGRNETVPVGTRTACSQKPKTHADQLVLGSIR